MAVHLAPSAFDSFLLYVFIIKTRKKAHFRSSIMHLIPSLYMFLPLKTRKELFLEALPCFSMRMCCILVGFAVPSTHHCSQERHAFWGRVFMH